MKSSLQAWISAVRPRTLPLALASIGMGSFLAASYQSFHWNIFILSVSTTLFLQILSNLANDYGDTVHGADSVSRIGPLRSVQSGQITLLDMKRAIQIFAILSLASGLTLLFVSLSFNFLFLLFFVLGILAIAAAIKYTSGKNPYGYSGWGDLSVFIFFGLIGVTGTFYLHTKVFRADILLLSAALGFFSTAVLNINNIRDISSDAAAGKRSIPVRVGEKAAKYYHLFLLTAGVLCSLIYATFHFTHSYQYIFLITIPLFVLNGYKVFTARRASLDPFLRQMAVSTLLFMIGFGCGALFGN